MAEDTRETLGRALRAGGGRLAASSETPALDARLLAQEAFELDPAGLILRAEAAADPAALGRFRALVDRRAMGEPVHRILGRRAFRDHVFELSPETLEPRPDTELLVDLAARAFTRVDRADFVFADIGTGTGAIGVSLLQIFERAVCLAVDLSVGALETARRNAASAGVGERFLPVAADYLDALSDRLDAVVCNPPYIASGEIGSLSPDVREHDPVLALDGGRDGLDAYRALALGSARLRVPLVLLEIGAGQEADVAALFAAQGFRLDAAECDLGGHVRALELRPNDEFSPQKRGMTGGRGEKRLVRPASRL